MNLEKIKEEIDNYYKVTILFFTLIGASFQMINLILISIDSIKFFSLTSAISDTIIIFVNIFIFSIFTLIFKLIISSLFWDFSQILLKPKIFKSSIFFKKYDLLIYITIFSILSYIDFKFKIINLFYTILLLSSFTTIFYTLLFESIPRIIKELKTPTYYLIISFSSILAFPFIFPKFSVIYDKKIINISNYEKKLLEKYERVNIKYFNDKYIFTLVKENNTELLIIEEIDEFF